MRRRNKLLLGKRFALDLKSRRGWVGRIRSRDLIFFFNRLGLLSVDPRIFKPIIQLLHIKHSYILQNFYFGRKYRNLISSNPPFLEWRVRFTTVSINPRMIFLYSSTLVIVDIFVFKLFYILEILIFSFFKLQKLDIYIRIFKNCFIRDVRGL